jgi:omega-amidase
VDVVLVQPDVAWEDREATFSRVRSMLEASPPRAGALVALPEMFAVGFSMNVDAIWEEEGGPTERFLAELARRYDVCVLGGVVHRAPDGRGLNDAVAVAPDGRILARYSKIHPFSYAGETNHYASGLDVVTFEWSGFVVAPFICYDLRFPEIYRIAVRRGANLFVTIANFPAARVHHWISLLVARAVENQAYSAGVNRSGADPNVTYPGRSMVVDPQGRVTANVGETACVLKARLNLDELDAYRRRFPALRDLRPEFLSPGQTAGSR